MSYLLGDEDMILRLGDIIHGHDFERIEYRIYLPKGGDMFVGACKYENGELIALDGDIYSLNDRVLKYHLYSENKLTVWVDDWGDK